MSASTAQHQHYVPRHLLRGFLSTDPNQARKEQVRVFDLQDEKAFHTSIENIMGERRYNDWWHDEETMLTLEPGVGKVEDHVFPLITRLRETQRLNLTDEEHSGIALLLAFQFLRAKKMRTMLLRMDRQFRHGIAKRGWRVEQVEGYREPDEETIKEDHIRQQIRSLGKFTEVMAEKVFFLATAPKGKRFYLGDNPVVMANDEKRGPWGNLGIGVPFIQLYLPLSSEVLLCAYSREVLGGWLMKHDEAMKEARRIVMDRVTSGTLPLSMMRPVLDKVDAEGGLKQLLANIKAGLPTQLEDGMVDRYNSLQAFYAVRWVVDSRGDFNVARQMIPERRRAEAEMAGDDVLDVAAKAAPAS